MYNYRRSLNQEQPTNHSKRWQTTTSVALSETAAAIRDIDRNALVEDIRTRKIHNTKSSINFGNNKIDYVSDMMDNQRRCQTIVDPIERDAQRLRNKNMKSELTQTSFTLGNDKPEYESINHSAMAEAERFQGAAKTKLFGNLKQQIKESSIVFGHEPTNYHTTSHDAMEYRGNSQNFEKTRNEIKSMKANLRKHNFNFGDDRIDYTSDYQRGYSTINSEHYKAAGQYRDAMNIIKNDLRATHWAFGNEKVKYLSDTHEALQAAEGENRASEVQKNIARARQMKQELQKTSYIIGTDEDYQ